MKENREGEEKDEDDSDSAARKSTFNQLVSKSEKSVAKTRRRHGYPRSANAGLLLALRPSWKIDTILQSYASTITTASDLPKPTLKSWAQGIMSPVSTSRVLLNWPLCSGSKGSRYIIPLVR